jgi:hypothetical protein
MLTIIIWMLAVEVRVGDEGRIRRHQERVAVGRSLGDGFGADLAGAAGLVLHDDLLAPVFCEPLRQGARATMSVMPPGANGTTM